MEENPSAMKTVKAKILFTEPKYKSYKVLDNEDNELNYDFDFSKDKIFHEDQIEIVEQPRGFQITHSAVRNQNHISGILVLSNNKTYGRVKDKFVYRCIPDNKFLPTFLIPYGKKIGFDKKQTNLYVTFTYHHWNDKHPRGKLNQVIGPVSELSAFYEYQLYCKSLNASIQRFNRDTSQRLKRKTELEFIEQILNEHPSVKDLTKNNGIFTIDSKSCCDYDDALEYNYISETDKHVIRIHIANVSLWMDVLNLWDSFSDRISTIYLPDRKRPMLPTCLSECLCSLVEKQKRFVFTCEIVLDSAFAIKSIDFYNSLIIVYKNHVYESTNLLNDINYKNLLSTVREMNKYNKNKMLPVIKSSHDVVTYLMILMNFHVSKKLIDYDDGIYRSAFMRKDLELPDSLDEQSRNFITAWSSQAGEYVLYSNKGKHEWLDLDTYCHMTSPIRRLVDLLNSVICQQRFGITALSENADQFVEKWKKKMSYINTCMKYIRKVQTECSLLSLFHEQEKHTKKNILYKGVMFNSCKKDDGTYIYNVYLPEIKLLSKLKLFEEYTNYSSATFQMFYFKDENTLKQKIRLQIV